MPVLFAQAWDENALAKSAVEHRELRLSLNRAQGIAQAECDGVADDHDAGGVGWCGFVGGGGGAVWVAEDVGDFCGFGVEGCEGDCEGEGDGDGGCEFAPLGGGVGAVADGLFDEFVGEGGGGEGDGGLEEEEGPAVDADAFLVEGDVDGPVVEVDAVADESECAEGFE